MVYPNQDEGEKQRAYACDITYATNNELGFDYLRDNMKTELSQMYQKQHHFAIVDEVDSILIDEARTPLIISGQAQGRSADPGPAPGSLLPLDSGLPRARRGEAPGAESADPRSALHGSGVGGFLAICH